MKYLLLLALAIVTPLLSVAKEARSDKFTLSGQIEGLQKGDTVRFEQIMLPGWTMSPGFDVIVRKPGQFNHKGTQSHDQYYLMTYLPKSGTAKRSDRRGRPLIVTNGDKITLVGTADQIYYSALSGGIYDDPKFARYLFLDDSVGQIRGSYVRLSQEAMERRDTATGQEYERKFNLFYQNNPGIEQVRAARKAYAESHPEGTLDGMIDLLSGLFYTPLNEARAAYEKFSPDLKASYYGRLYVEQMETLEQLAPGQPAPDFTLVTTEGKTVKRDEFKENYLLIYHWGMCPGSIYIDGQVRALYDKYKDKGLKMIGLTESIADVRKVYESLPKDKKTEGAGVDDIRPVLGGMLEHAWTEVELETNHPGNQEIMKAYKMSGWPFFVFIGPDGKMLARNFTDAFFEARTILDRELGDK